MTAAPKEVWTLATLRAGLDQLGAHVRDYTDPAQLAMFIKQAREIRAEFAQFIADTEDRYCQVAGEKVLEIPGVGVVEIKRATTRTAWDHEALWSRVTARALDEREVDPDTGAFEREADTVARVLRDCATPSWKVTGLRAHGIDPDEWCHTDYGRHSVVIR